MAVTRNGDNTERPWRPASVGQAFVYAFPCHGEDILKLGFSRDPLDRIQTLHQRYFEFFDLDRAVLVETDKVREARAIEHALKVELALHNAPAPLVVQPKAGGRTEWFRGALVQLTDAVIGFEQQGYRVHRDVRAWMRDRLVERGSILYHWSSRMLEAVLGDGVAPGAPRPSTPLERTLRNALDAYRAFNLPIGEFVPEEVAEWYDASPLR
jgi:hypothetical protein